MLHMVFKASSLQDCLSQIGPGDVVLLLDDGIHGAGEIGEDKEGTCRIVVLHEQANARHLNADQLATVEQITYDDFVDLAAEHKHSRSWF